MRFFNSYNKRLKRICLILALAYVMLPWLIGFVFHSTWFLGDTLFGIPAIMVGICVYFWPSILFTSLSILALLIFIVVVWLFLYACASLFFQNKK
jgi:hypothetical protein